MTSKSLYERLGGADGIAGLVDGIVAAHLENPVIKMRYHRFLEDPAHLAVAKRHLCQFLGAGSGGPEQYEGLGMLDAHRGMNINEAEYMAALDDILSSMQKRAYDDETQRDVLAIAYSLRGEILHV